MQLSDVLSKHPCNEYKQINGFLQHKKGIAGQKVDISVGSIAINFFAKNVMIYVHFIQNQIYHVFL